MAMVEPLRRAVNCAIELHTDVRFILRIVEEHLPFDHLHASALRGAHRPVLPMVTLSRK